MALLVEDPGSSLVAHGSLKESVDERNNASSVERISLCNTRPSIITKVLLVYHIALVITFGYAFFPYTLHYGLWMVSVIFICAICSLYMKKAILIYPFLIWVAATFVLFIFLGAYLFFYSIFISKSAEKDPHDSSLTSIAIHLANVIFCLFHLWQIHVVDLCRKELKASAKPLITTVASGRGDAFV